MRYYFNTADGTRDRDDVGYELPDHAAPRAMASRYLGEILRDEPNVPRDLDLLRVDVTNHHGLILFSLSVVSLDAAVAS